MRKAQEIILYSTFGDITRKGLESRELGRADSEKLLGFLSL